MARSAMRSALVSGGGAGAAVGVGAGGVGVWAPAAAHIASAIPAVRADLLMSVMFTSRGAYAHPRLWHGGRLGSGEGRTGVSEAHARCGAGPCRSVAFSNPRAMVPSRKSATRLVRCAAAVGPQGESMRFDNVSILSVEHVDAPHCLSSAEIEERLAPAIRRLGVRPNLLQELSGIVERRLWDPGTTPSEPATRAGERAIEAAGIDRARIGVLVNTSVSRDYLEPSTGCAVHHGLSLSEDCVNFDVSNACLGFVNGMDVVGNMIERGQVDYGIVVNAESSRPLIEATIPRLLDDSLDARDLPQQLREPDSGLGGGGDGARPLRPRRQRPPLPGRGQPRRHRELPPVLRQHGPHGHRHPGADRGRSPARAPDLAARGGAAGLDDRPSRPLRAAPGQQGPRREVRRDPRPRHGQGLPALPDLRQRRAGGDRDRAVEAREGEDRRARATSSH